MREDGTLPDEIVEEAAPVAEALDGTPTPFGLSRASNALPLTSINPPSHPAGYTASPWITTF